MRPMPGAVRHRLTHDLRAARRAVARGDLDAAWRCLEEAHVLSQPWALRHVQVHWRMLSLAARTRAGHEVTGQLVRLAVAAPGSWAKRYPVGNTGRASVGMMTPIPVPSEIARLLEG